MAAAAFLLLCGGMGVACGLAAFANWHPWYATLRPPPLALPERLLATFWAIVDIEMAAAGWLIWRVPDVKMLNLRALIPWGWLLVLKAGDVCVLFGAHLLLIHALITLSLLGLAVVVVRRFWALNQSAAWLMVPYCLWIAFEIYLSLGFWWLNA